MRKLYLLLLISAISYTAIGQNAYWQQEVHYTIDVSLNDSEHSLEGFLKLRYVNHSPDTLRFIWFHLCPNAFKNDKTAFTDQTRKTVRRISISRPAKKRVHQSPRFQGKWPIVP